MASYIDKLIGKAKDKAQEEPEETKEKALQQRVETYNQVEILQEEDNPLMIYSVPVIKPTGPEKMIVNTVQEAATRLITVSPEEFRDPQARKAYYIRRVKEIITQNPELQIPATKIDFYTEMVVQEMIGYGILDNLVSDSNLEEIMVIGAGLPVYVYHVKYGMMQTNIVFGTNEEINNIISRIARQVNRRVDLSDPMLDARLPDGSRVNATVSPISLEGSTLTIRKFRTDPFTIINLIKEGTIDLDLAAFLWYAVEGSGYQPANILISGGTSSGKTTTLNVLASMIPPTERIISIEDTAELVLPIKHWVRFETRPPGLEGSGEITMDALMKNVLRMRPDRVIVGEVRGEEAFTLFTAMNTGHSGSMGTIHANSASETLTRITSPPMNVPMPMVNALDFILVQQRIRDAKKGMIRRVTEVAETQTSADGVPKMQTLWSWNPVSDKFMRHRNESAFEAQVKMYTGMSSSDVSNELNKRKKILEDLLMHDKTSMDVVSKEIQEYCMEQRGKKIEIKAKKPQEYKEKPQGSNKTISQLLKGK